MARGKAKQFSVITLLIILVIGVVLGELMIYFSKGIAALSWLSIGRTIGLTSPIVLDLSVVSFTLGFSLHVNVAVILGILISSLLYRFVF